MTAISASGQAGVWRGEAGALRFGDEALRAALLNLDQPCFVLRLDGRLAATNDGDLTSLRPASGGEAELLAVDWPARPDRLGDPAFRQAHQVRLNYAAGAMANGIASENLVIAMGRAGLLATFGAAGLLPNRISAAIDRIQRELPNGGGCFNLIHNPSEQELERRTVELYLERKVRTVEASAFLDLTPHVVRYRVAGLSTRADGTVEAANSVIAKVSRREVAAKFLAPAPDALLRELVAAGWVSDEQARLAGQFPLCDDLTVEADSGGHTDNRPLVGLLPSLIELRDEIQEQYRYQRPVRVGAAGGIGTPASALAAFAMGAAYVVTGSINQSCVEAGTSAHTKGLLTQAGMADVMMAPAADMFEMGVKVQLLKKGTLFPMRAARLYDLYQAYESVEAIPESERERLEKQLFKRPLTQVWSDTEAYFRERDPEQIQLARENPKRKMALIFRWYLGLSSRWSNAGEPGREMDYQIWCGPAMGAFNDWVRGTYLEGAEARSAVDVAEQIMRGAAYLYRLNRLRLQGFAQMTALEGYAPSPE